MTDRLIEIVRNKAEETAVKYRELRQEYDRNIYRLEKIKKYINALNDLLVTERQEPVPFNPKENGGTG